MLLGEEIRFFLLGVVGEDADLAVGLADCKRPVLYLFNALYAAPAKAEFLDLSEGLVQDVQLAGGRSDQHEAATIIDAHRVQVRSAKLGGGLLSLDVVLYQLICFD